MKQSSPISELSENEARGETRQIYEEIKKLSGVQLVPLVYRHMATFPGVLEWAWSGLQPIMSTGELQYVSCRIANDLKLPTLATAAHSGEQINIHNEEEIINVLASFNRVNPINAIALQYLTRFLDSNALTPDVINQKFESHWSLPEPLPNLLPMPAIDQVDESVLNLIASIWHRDQDRHSGIWPTLYRYLATEPAFLALAATALSAISPAIDLATEEVRIRVQAAAESLPIVLVKRPSSLFEIEPALRRIIIEFSSAIPEMLVHGLLLERTYVRRETGEKDLIVPNAS